MTPVASRSREIVTQGITDQLGPVVQLLDELRAEMRPSADGRRVRERMAASLPAIDVTAAIRAAGDLSASFARAAKAFERAGVASTSASTALRQRRWNVVKEALAWAGGERPPSDPVAKLARRAGSLVGYAILSSTAEAVSPFVREVPWDRPTCPCCGGSADFALVNSSGRDLVCSRCDTTWTAPRSGCLGCGADSSPTIARIRSPFLGYTLAICNACGRYLKERAATEVCHPFVERALTVELDAAAERRGLRL